MTFFIGSFVTHSISGFEMSTFSIMAYAIVSISDTGSDKKNVRENKFNKKEGKG